MTQALPELSVKGQDHFQSLEHVTVDSRANSWASVFGVVASLTRVYRDVSRFGRKRARVLIIGPIYS